MKTFTVHEPLDPATDLLKRADQLVFVKEGVAWFALFFPILWLLFQRMWLVLALFILALMGVSIATMELGGNEQIALWASLALALLLAVQANDLRRWNLSRRGYRMVAAVAGRNRDECERRFFTDWAEEAEYDGTYLDEFDEVPGGWEKEFVSDPEEVAESGDEPEEGADKPDKTEAKSSKSKGRSSKK